MPRPTRRTLPVTMSAALVAALAAGAPGSARAQTPQPPAAPQLAVGAPEVVRSLGPGEEHVYVLPLRAAEFARAVVEQRGVDVIVRVVAPDGSQVIEVDSPNGANGPEPVLFSAAAAGTYRLLVRPFSNDPTRPGAMYAIRLSAVLSAAERQAEVGRERARTDSAIGWLAATAVPIRSVTAGSGFADLAPLKGILRDARVVGLGEATHGSREFFQFKHRMLEFLVREMGFRVFALEASLSAAENVIEPFVQGGPGEPVPVLRSQGFWTWDTEEVRDLLVWMRAYNQSVPASERVHFIGIDLQVNNEARRTVLDFLARVAPERVAQTRALFAVNMDSLSNVPFLSRDTAAVRRAIAQVGEAGLALTELLTFLDTSQTRFAARTSAAEAAKAARHARILAQHADAYGQQRSRAPDRRDQYMAENLRRYLDEAPAGTRVVMWAHNGHVRRAPSPGVPRPLGHWLKEAYGPAYYAVGFSFGGGAFQSRDPDPNAAQQWALTEFRLDAPAEGTADWALGQAADRVGAPVIFVDLRRLAPVGTAREWLAEPRGMVSIGSMFRRAAPPAVYTQPTVLPEAFDGVVYFRSTTRARPTRSAGSAAGDRQ